MKQKTFDNLRTLEHIEWKWKMRYFYGLETTWISDSSPMSFSFCLVFSNSQFNLLLSSLIFQRSRTCISSHRYLIARTKRSHLRTCFPFSLHEKGSQKLWKKSRTKNIRFSNTFFGCRSLSVHLACVVRLPSLVWGWNRMRLPNRRRLLFHHFSFVCLSLPFHLFAKHLIQSVTFSLQNIAQIGARRERICLNTCSESLSFSLVLVALPVSHWLGIDVFSSPSPSVVDRSQIIPFEHTVSPLVTSFVLFVCASALMLSTC